MAIASLLVYIRTYISPMTFEWDTQKTASNFRRHGVSFVAGAQALAGGNVLEHLDEREDYGEERVFALAPLEGRVLAIAYTVRGEVTRLISVRRATRYERETYWKTYPQAEERSEEKEPDSPPQY
jgi:uncharacterized DUF497 family protein